MYTVVLDENTIEDYAAYIGEDAADDIGRTFFRGLILLEEGRNAPIGWMIWELRNLEAKQHVESYIRWFEAEDQDEADVLFLRYNEMIAEDGVETSHVSIPATKESAKTRQILAEQGFDMLLMEGDDVAVGLSEILNMPVFKKSPGPSDFVHPLEDMPLRNFRKIITKLEMLGQKGTCEDLGYLPKSYFEKDVSCYYEDDSGIQGVLLFHKSPSGSLCLKVMRAVTGDHKETTRILMRLLFYAVGYMEENYPDNTRIIVDRHNDSAFLLAEKLFPRGFGKPVYGGIRMEKQA